MDVQQIASILRNVGRRGKIRPTSGRRALAWRTTLQPSLMKSRRTVLSRRCRGSLSFLGAGIVSALAQMNKHAGPFLPGGGHCRISLDSHSVEGNWGKPGKVVALAKGLLGREGLPHGRQEDGGA